MNSEGSWFLTAKVSFPPIETLNQNSPSTTSWKNLHQAFLRSHACSISMLVHSARRGRCWVTSTWKLCRPFTAETTNIPCWQQRCSSITNVRRGYLWVEEHGGHAVPVLLATSLDGEVDARRDPRHVVRRWQEVVAHLIIKLVWRRKVREAPFEKCLLYLAMQGQGPCPFVDAWLVGLGYLWWWFKTSPSEIESMQLMITWGGAIPSTGCPGQAAWQVASHAATTSARVMWRRSPKDLQSALL